MRNPVKSLLVAAVLSLATAASTAQTTVLVTNDISVSTVWTANNIYNLQSQIYVLPGASLTIEAGTLIASTTNMGGSLAVARGGQIYVQGTKENPVIMTSTSDVATWTAGDPKTGTWREAANEWGNLTIMGGGYISENATAGNTAVPSGSNVAAMEGLIAGFAGDTKVLYGGGNDNDNSGSINYLSIRYGGRVIGLNNELNGLSLGGIGRDTDISHIEIMNNVDDGIEIWGGAVNLKYFSIWNVGDDSFDVDQGWRGKAQFGLIVQGHSLDASQGSGVGDNAFETDGAEDSDWQPVTTATIYNCTVIGQPVDGDGLTAWRDNARVQYRNCIFMDCGEKVVRFDNVDGDGANGYGHNGTLSWNATWTTPYTATSTVNAAVNPAAFYQTQTSGNLSEIKDSVFYNNLAASAYGDANGVGVFAPANNNVMEPTSSPIRSITRGPQVLRGNKIMVPVIGLDPRATNDALTPVAWADGTDSFFDCAPFRGAFSRDENWLIGWTAASAFGFTSQGGGPAGPGQPADAANALQDINGAVNANSSSVFSTTDPNGPHFAHVCAGQPMNITFSGQPNKGIIWVFSSQLNPGTVMNPGLIGQWDIGGSLNPALGVPNNLNLVADGTSGTVFGGFFNTGPTGTTHLSLQANFPLGTELNLQAIMLNSSSVVRFSNAVNVRVF